MAERKPRKGQQVPPKERPITEQLQNIQTVMSDELHRKEMVNRMDQLLNWKSEGPADATQFRTLLTGLIQDLMKEKDLLQKRQAEYLEKSNELTALQNKYERLKTEADKKINELNVERKRMRTEEERLRGKSKSDKCLILLDDLKQSIKCNNIAWDDAVAQGMNVDEFNAAQHLAVREWGIYTFSIDDPYSAQKTINEVIQSLTQLIDQAEPVKLTPRAERVYEELLGELEGLHFRMNWLSKQKSIESVEPTPTELIRLFSALDTGISSLAMLDKFQKVTEGLESMLAGFTELDEDEKNSFIDKTIELRFVENLSKDKRDAIWDRLCSLYTLHPEQVIEQMGRMGRLAPTMREETIRLLSAQLVEREQLIIAERAIKELKQKQASLSNSE